MTVATSVSVVIPLFNKEREVARAVRSVLSQTVPAGEVVVVDDGSTDRGAEAVQKLADPRVRVVSQRNGGVSVARNRGVAEAKGGLIAFLDADDEWKPGFLAAVLSLRDRYPDAGLWATAFELVEGGAAPVQVHCKGVPRDIHGGLVRDFLRSCLKVPPICASGFVVPRSVFTEVGGFPCGVALGEDMVLWVRVSLKHTVAYAPSVQVVYHKDASNRAMDRHRYKDGNTALGGVLREALGDGRLPGRLRRSVQLLLAQHLLEVARHAAERGDGAGARGLIREVLLRHHAFPFRCLRRWARSYRTSGR